MLDKTGLDLATSDVLWVFYFDFIESGIEALMFSSTTRRQGLTVYSDEHCKLNHPLTFKGNLIPACG
jgi:hypothetical protein